MIRKSLISLAAAALLGIAATGAKAQYASYGQPQQANNGVAMLTSNARTNQTQYFSFAQAPTFQVIDQSTNGVILGSQQLSATYGMTGLLSNAITGCDYYAVLCGQSYQNVKLLGAQDVAPAQGFLQGKYYDFTYTAAGQTFRGGLLVYVTNGSAVAYHIASRPENFDQLKPALLQLATTCHGNNANSFGAVAQFQATRPLGNYGIGDWKPTSQAPSEQQSQARSDAMLGHDTMYDPETGKTYQMDYSQYRPDLGGYVNPDDPTRLLNYGTPTAPQPRGYGWGER